MKAIEKLIATAAAEIGYLEKKSNAQLDSKTANAGSGNWNKYARDLDNLGTVYNGRKNGYAWCDVFVDWCFITTFGLETGMALLCQPYKGAGAGCTYSAKYFKNKGQFHSQNPLPGDQIFFTNDGGKTSYHTGLVVEVSEGKVFTIEGNTSGAAGVVENGGCVSRKSYALNSLYIMGYGRPDYSIIPVDAPKKETELSGMTQEKFNQMFKTALDAYRAQLRDNDNSEWSQAAREFAVEKGIFNGAGAGPDGKPNFMWEDFMTREQAAQMLYRFAQKHGLTQ